MVPTRRSNTHHKRLATCLPPHPEAISMAVDLAFLTIAEASALIKSRPLSPLEHVEALIIRPGPLAPQLPAYIPPTFARARQQARQAEHDIAAGTYRGPLHGIPFALKDIYDTQGIRTSGHSKVCLQRIPDTDATATRKLCEEIGRAS